MIPRASPFRFGYSSVSSLQGLLYSSHPRAQVVPLPNTILSLQGLLYSSHPRAQVVPLPNPIFEPKTHR